MGKNSLGIVGGVVFLFLLLAGAGEGLEKAKVGTAIRAHPLFILPPMAALERGFWKEEGLEVEWVAFGSGEAQAMAMVTGDVAIAITTTGAATRHASRGVPMTIVADLGGFQPWWLWVRAKGPIREAKDLAGRRLGVSRLRSLEHLFALTIIKGLGLDDKAVKFVGSGGFVENLAAMRAGVVDAVSVSEFAMARMEFEGVARRLVSLADFVGRDFDPLTISSAKDFIEKQDETLKRVIKGILRAGEYIEKNPSWSIGKIKTDIGYPDPVAEKVYRLIGFSRDGRIYPERIKKVREFLLGYAVIPKEKTPPLETQYNDKFVPITLP